MSNIPKPNPSPSKSNYNLPDREFIPETPPKNQGKRKLSRRVEGAKTTAIGDLNKDKKRKVQQPEVVTEEQDQKKWERIQVWTKAMEQVDCARRILSSIENQIEDFNHIESVKSVFWDSASALADNGYTEDAILLIEEAICIFPEEKRLHRGLALLYQNTRNNELAQRHLEEAIRLGDHSPGTLLKLGRICALRKNYERGLKLHQGLMNQIEALSEEQKLLLFKGLTNILCCMKSYLEAVKYGLLGLSYFPECQELKELIHGAQNADLKAARMLSSSIINQNKYEHKACNIALAQFQHAIEMQPLNARVYSEAIELALRSGNNAAALNFCNQALGKLSEKEHSRFKCLKALILVKQNSPEFCPEAGELLLSCQPFKANGYYEFLALGRLYIAQEDHLRAINCLGVCLNFKKVAEPLLAQTLRGNGTVLFNEGNYKEALLWLTLYAENHNTEDLENIRMLGVCHYMLRDYSGAIENLNYYMEEGDGNAPDIQSLRMCGISYFMTKMYSSAILEIECYLAHIEEQGDTDPEMVYLLGICHHREEHFRSAIEAFEKFITYNDDPDGIENARGFIEACKRGEGVFDEEDIDSSE